MSRDDSSSVVANLPSQLPQTFDQYLRWVKRRDGFREKLEGACSLGPGGSKRLKKDLAKALAQQLARQNPEAAGDANPTARSIQDRLRSFFQLDPSGDLPLDLLSGMLRATNIDAATLRSWLRRAPPFDVWRAQWATSSAQPKPIHLKRIGMKIQRVQPSAATRVISAYLRTQSSEVIENKPELAAGPPLYTSPASGFVYVVKGEARAHFLGRESMPIREGHGLLYNMRHPHAFEPLTKDMALLDVTATMHGGVPSELYVNKWDRRKYAALEAGIEDVGTERFGLDSVRRLIAFALSSNHMRIEELSRFTSINVRRLREIAHGRVVPDVNEVLEVAHVCRLPEEVLFTPYSEYRERSIVLGPFDARGDLNSFERSSPNTHVWYGRNRAGRDLREGELSAWELRFVGRPPTLIVDSPEDLEVGLFICRGPGDREHAATETHHESYPAEELLFVLDGQLGVRLRDEHDTLCEGVLDVGDAIWFSSRLRHCFYAPRGRESRSLHFRQPLPKGSETVAPPSSDVSIQASGILVPTGRPASTSRASVKDGAQGSSGTSQ